MIGSYVLSFQVYLALPLQARDVLGNDAAGTALVAGLFVISGGVAIIGQLRITAWRARRWSAGGSLSIGLA